MENNNTQLPNNDSKGQSQSQNQNQQINIYTHGTNVQRTADGVVITPIVKKTPFYKSWKFWLAIAIVAIAITLMVFGILYAMDVEIFGEVETDHSGGDGNERPDSVDPDIDSPEYDHDYGHDDSHGDHH